MVRFSRTFVGKKIGTRFYGRSTLVLQFLVFGTYRNGVERNQTKTTWCSGTKRRVPAIVSVQRFEYYGWRSVRMMLPVNNKADLVYLVHPLMVTGNRVLFLKGNNQKSSWMIRSKIWDYAGRTHLILRNQGSVHQETFSWLFLAFLIMKQTSPCQTDGCKLFLSFPSHLLSWEWKSHGTVVAHFEYTQSHLISILRRHPQVYSHPWSCISLRKHVSRLYLLIPYKNEHPKRC